MKRGINFNKDYPNVKNFKVAHGIVIKLNLQELAYLQLQRDRPISIRSLACFP
jgi:hypothetical protein